ncbi:MAG: tRNA (adenine-N1)-methyltransferase [Candidatus Lokiarchaeota archaeon]|nr:tRNA (adenine-N1)-methyltransferase [Candidatus Lokiarchaeota archaeon]
MLIARGAKQQWLVKMERGKQFHTNWGVISHDGIIGREFGDVYTSTTSNVSFLLVKPLPHELATRFGRKTQIVYPKDIGFVLVNAGIVPGSRVLEAGTGSGAMTAMLATVAGGRTPGTVVSYEVVERHHEAAKRNVELAGLSRVADLRLGSVLEPAARQRLLGEAPFDACFFDMPSPWDAVGLAGEVLRPCGVFCSFSPVVEQVKKVHAALSAGNWYSIEAVDMQLRTWQVKENATRPVSHGRHSGYLVFARKVNAPPPMEWNRKTRKELARELRDAGELDDDAEVGDLFDE